MVEPQREVNHGVSRRSSIHGHGSLANVPSIIRTANEAAIPCWRISVVLDHNKEAAALQRKSKQSAKQLLATRLRHADDERIPWQMLADMVDHEVVSHDTV